VKIKFFVCNYWRLIRVGAFFIIFFKVEVRPDLGWYSVTILNVDFNLLFLKKEGKVEN